MQSRGDDLTGEERGFIEGSLEERRSEEEAAQLAERIEAASEALGAALLEGVVAAMNRFNRDAASEAADG